MEEIIKKWELILQQNNNKNIIYDRNILQEMLDDFKRAIWYKNNENDLIKKINEI